MSGEVKGATAVDAYEVARQVRHYIAKNGYAPAREMLGCTSAEADELVANRILEAFSLYEGGPAVQFRLTDKGLRMAQAPRRRR